MPLNPLITLSMFLSSTLRPYPVPQDATETLSRKEDAE